jgi:DnaK suppressor protein
MTLDLDRYRGELLALQATLRGASASLEHDRSANDETGELPTWGPDELADHASDTLDREMDESLDANAGEILREIGVALQRIDDGTYGTCSACGADIPVERLDAVPYATLCVEDKRRQERG